MANFPQYQYEGIAWYAAAVQVGNSKPVYRFYNATNGSHFYTSSEAERQSILKNLPSYALEGIVFWAW
jgi:lysyl endopeptidase